MKPSGVPGSNGPVCAVDLVSLVAHYDNWDMGEVPGLVDLVEEIVDVVKRVRSFQVVNKNVSICISQAISWFFNDSLIETLMTQAYYVYSTLIVILSLILCDV